MHIPSRTATLLTLSLFLSLMLTGSACHSLAAPPPPAAPAIDPLDVWRKNLPELAKGHDNKVQLGWYASSIFRHLDSPVKDFAKNMHDQQKVLAKRLETWAKAHNISLKFTFPDNVPGQARKALEKADGKIIQDDDNPNFQRDMLIDMQSDYDWQRHLIATLIPLATDPELKSYLQDSLKIHEDHFAQIRQLLSHYKWQN